MERSSFLLLTFGILLVVGLTASTHAIPPAQLSATQEAREEFVATFKLIRAANLAGASNDEVSGVAEKLNKALQLIEQSEQFMKEAREPEADRLAQQAIQILSSAQSEAQNLQVRAEQRTAQNKVLTYALAPLMAILSVMAYHFGLSAYRRYRTARALKMTVRVRSIEKKQ